MSEIDLEALSLAMRKTAETVENNKDQPTTGVVNVYPSDKSRESGTLDAPWGEKPHPDRFHHSDSVWDEYMMSRPKLLDRLFDSKKPASVADKALISQNFGVRDYESHSPLLQKESQVQHVTGERTLSELVRSTCGRR